MSFGNPSLLWLLWLVPLVVVFLVAERGARTRAFAAFTSEALHARVVRGASRARVGAKIALIGVAVACLVLSLAELTFGYSWEDVRRRGVDLVVALDVSDSMLVEDVESGAGLTRLARAKREIVDLLQRLDGDRIGLVAFAGTAFVQLPLTLDYNAAQLFVDEVAVDMMPVKGTAIAEAIRTSVRAFEGAHGDSRAVVLITDGEDTEGEAVAAAQAAAKEGVKIFAIGIGRPEGAPVPSEEGGFRRDDAGELVLSRLDEATLQQVASATGGGYVRAVTGDFDLEQIYERGIKASLSARDLGDERRKRGKQRFQWLLAAALFALMVESLMSERRREELAV